MATRAIVAMRNDDGTFSGVYLHQGDVKSIWNMLPNTANEVRELIAGGSISCLVHNDFGNDVVRLDDCYDNPENPKVFTAASVTELWDLCPYSHTEHVLLFENGSWLVTRLLTDEVLG